jgi:dihydrolipoamide dehydrogenase
MLHRTVIGSRRSAEGINCVEKIAGIHVDPIDYGNVPGCICSPEIASVGLTEKQARKKDTN